MGRRSGNDGFQKWLTKVSERQLRRHRGGAVEGEVPDMARPPLIGKCRGNLVWSLRHGAFVGREEVTASGTSRHYVSCSSRAKLFDTVELALASARAMTGGGLAIYAMGVNAPMFLTS